jgi:hypothetical protein
MDDCGEQASLKQLPPAVMGILRPFDKRSRDMESIMSLPNHRTLHGQSRDDPLESETAELRSRTPMVVPEEAEPDYIAQRCKRRRTQNKTLLSEPDLMISGRTRHQPPNCKIPKARRQSFCTSSHPAIALLLLDRVAVNSVP